MGVGGGGWGWVGISQANLSTRNTADRQKATEADVLLLLLNAAPKANKNLIKDELILFFSIFGHHKPPAGGLFPENLPSDGVTWCVCVDKVSKQQHG